MENQKKRFDELEGLRGIAAIVVAVYHALLIFYVVAFLGTQTGSAQNMGLEDNLYGNPIMVFLSGTFAVAIFFVLSGFVLSIGFFQTQKMEILKKLATKRYLRLMLPALASILLCFVILALGASRLHEVAAITRTEWLAQIWTFSPDFFKAIKSGVYDIFIYSGNSYNSVLWTMMYEFLGSFLVFGFLALFGKLKYRWVLYIFLAFATFNSWFFAFVAGMVIADLYAAGRLKTKKYNWRLVAPLAVVVLFLGGYPYASAKGTVYEYLTIAGLDVDWKILYLTVASVGVVAIILLVEQAGALFRRPILSKVGKYTFALYLIHLPVLYTFGMVAFLLFNQTLGLGYNWSALLAIIASIPVVAGATFLFERYVDSPSVHLSSYVTNILLGYKEPPKVTRKLKAAYQRVVQQFAARIGRQPALVPDELDAE